jgi:hypothetical protein
MQGGVRPSERARGDQRRSVILRRGGEVNVFRRAEALKRSEVPTDLHRRSVRRFIAGYTNARAVGSAREVCASGSFAGSRPRFDAIASTHRHGPALVPSKHSSHAFGDGLSSPEVLLDSSSGSLSRARGMRAVHRGASEMPPTPRASRPSDLTAPRRRRAGRTQWGAISSKGAKSLDRRVNFTDTSRALDLCAWYGGILTRDLVLVHVWFLCLSPLFASGSTLERLCDFSRLFLRRVAESPS